MSASLNGPLTAVAPSAPADAPSRPTPTTTPATASHSRQASSTLISHAASTAVTARLPATIACTANSGSRRNATSWARNPIRSRARLATNRHWRSMRTTRPGSTLPSGVPGAPPSGDRRLAARTATACITAAIP